MPAWNYKWHDLEVGEVDNINDLDAILEEIENSCSDLNETDAELDKLISELEEIGMDEEF